MASYGPGHLEDRDQRWVGPAAWEDWVVVVEALGGTLVDEGPLAPDEPDAPGFDEGWLAELPEVTARAAAEAILGRTGRAVTVLAASVSAEVQGTSIHLTSRVARERLDPDRRWSATAKPAESGDDFDGEGGVREDDLAWMFTEVSAIGALATDPERVPRRPPCTRRSPRAASGWWSPPCAPVPAPAPRGSWRPGSTTAGPGARSRTCSSSSTSSGASTAAAAPPTSTAGETALPAAQASTPSPPPTTPIGRATTPPSTP
jgi:hypothetical protein